MRRTREQPAAIEHVPVLTFDALYATEYRAMVRLAFVMLNQASAAEEVVQDAFARVYERWAKLEHPGGYLRTCVVNGCRDVQRRQHRLARLRPAASAPETSAEADLLLDALDVLPPERRAAVVLRYYADLPEAAIAELLDVRPGTVKSMLHRSLRQLREVIER